jgi:cell wall-associated NlpC family hydrolase
VETGDVVFVRSNTWISKLVRHFDKGRFSHVAIAVSNGRVIEAQYNIKSKVRPLKYKSYEVFPMDLTDKQKRHLASILKKYKGKKYDFLLAFSMTSNWFRLDNPNYMICSELAVDILKEIGVLDPNLRDMKPNEFYDYLTVVRPKRIAHFSSEE